MTEALHTFYRPQKFEEVVGQAGAVKALQTACRKGGSQAFLFSGPAGTGKTTLARITARELGCRLADIMELDAATRTSIDDMRALQEVLQYVPLGKGERKAVLLDECHRLSKQAWDSMLKIVEEPPPHVIFLFCTTEPGKVPTTIKSRCSHIQLKPLADKELGALYDEVCEAEKIELAGDVGDVIIKEARGSARQMLVNLELCQEAKNKKEAAEILRSAIDSEPAIELCKFLMNGGSWQKAMAIVAKMDGENAESVRIVVMNYVGAALKGSKSDREACHFLSILEAFAVSYNASEQMSPLLMSIGRVIFAPGME
jgi:DNA polymerase-3 subunit gamma/tau